MATGGVLLRDQLVQYLPGVLERRFEMLKFESGLLIPTTSDLEVGAYELIREAMDMAGEAAIVGDEDTSIPVVDASSSEDRYPTLMLAAGVSLSFQQERRFSKSGSGTQGMNAQRIQQNKLRAAEKVLAEKANSIAAYGSSAHGIEGFYNNSSVTQENNSIDFHDAATTADTMAEFFIDGVGTIIRDTGGVESPDRVIVSIDIDLALQKKRIPDSQVSVKQYILQNSDLISSIEWANESSWDRLESAGVLPGNTNDDRIVIYPRMPEVIERHNEPTQMAPADFVQVRDMTRIYPLFHCVSPTIINFPGACRYIDVPKKA